VSTGSNGTRLGYASRMEDPEGDPGPGDDRAPGPAASDEVGPETDGSTARVAPDPTAETDDADPRAARAVRSIVGMSRGFERLCQTTELSLPQYRLMTFLRHGPKRAGALAAGVLIQRPTLTALVTGLEKDGRLRRVADENDGRGVHIEITSSGLDALKRTEDQLVALLENVFAHCDREQMLDALDDFAIAVDTEINRRLREGQSPD